MLKKAGIAAAVATAGLLALSPLAFAADDETNGIDKGNNFDEGNENEVCNTSFLVDDLPPVTDSPGEDCEVEAEAYGQKREQYDKND